jgi:hypothetical protein
MLPAACSADAINCRNRVHSCVVHAAERCCSRPAESSASSAWVVAMSNSLLRTRCAAARSADHEPELPCFYLSDGAGRPPPRDALLAWLAFWCPSRQVVRDRRVGYVRRFDDRPTVAWNLVSNAVGVGAAPGGAACCSARRPLTTRWADNEVSGSLVRLFDEPAAGDLVLTRDLCQASVALTYAAMLTTSVRLPMLICSGPLQPAVRRVSRPRRSYTPGN